MNIRSKFVVGFSAISMIGGSAAAQAALPQNGDAFERIRSTKDPEYDLMRQRNLRIRRPDPQIAFVFNGASLARKVRAVRPGIPFILYTGFNEGLTQERLKDLGVGAVLTKPIPRVRLATEIHRILDGTVAR